MEEEGEDQENEKEDEREDGKQRVEGRVVESQKQPHHERMKMGWSEMCATHSKLELQSMSM